MSEAAEEGDRIESRLFKNGTVVKFVGLQGRPELNGSYGWVTGFLGETQRYKVRLSDGQTMCPKPGNLTQVLGFDVLVGDGKCWMRGCQHYSRESFRCKTCGRASYCSDECKSSHRPMHQRFCVGETPCQSAERRWVEDDKRVRLRRPHHHMVPTGWPRDVIDCGYCGERHARNFCCEGGHGYGSQEFHSGELELIGWNFDPADVGDRMGADQETLDDIYKSDQEVRPLFGYCDPAEDSVQTIVDLGCDYKKMFDEMGGHVFRWSCCGATGGQVCGCDHHLPDDRGDRDQMGCSCDYCRGWMGEDGELNNVKRPEAHNRFLFGIRGYSRFVWDSMIGVKWDRVAHRYFPNDFRREVQSLVLIGNITKCAVLEQEELFEIIVKYLVDSYMGTHSSMGLVPTVCHRVFRLTHLCAPGTDP